MTSCPGTRGYCTSGKVPSLVRVSLWQMPQAWTLIRTVPGPGSGISRSTISKGAFGRETCTARILGITPPSTILAWLSRYSFSHPPRHQLHESWMLTPLGEAEDRSVRTVGHLAA